MHLKYFSLNVFIIALSLGTISATMGDNKASTEYFREAVIKSLNLYLPVCS